MHPQPPLLPVWLLSLLPLLQRLLLLVLPLLQVLVPMLALLLLLSHSALAYPLVVHSDRTCSTLLLLLFLLQWVIQSQAW